MALVPDGVQPREDVAFTRFKIAQDAKPTEPQLSFQMEYRAMIAEAADELNLRVEDSREKSLALTHLEEALMWAGKAIFK